MTKTDLLNWLREENRQWQALLAEIGLPRMDQPGVNGDWSMKDMVAHLTGWNIWVAARLEAAQSGESQPLPPWPEHLEGDDEINAWIYETYRARPVAEILDTTDQTNEEIRAIVAKFPEDARIDVVEPAYYLVWIGDKRFQPGEFFDHFHDDHEADVRAWLAQG